MKRRTFKRRNPMAAVVRRMKPKRIQSARDYRRKVKHRKPLRDMSSEAVFVCTDRMAAMRNRRWRRARRSAKRSAFETAGTQTNAC